MGSLWLDWAGLGVRRGGGRVDRLRYKDVKRERERERESERERERER